MKNELLKQLSATFSLVVASVLIVIKLIAWFFSGSLIILSSTVDSLLDLTTSLINFVAIKYSAKPSDSDHKFGHTAIEDIAGLIQSIFIGLSGIFIIFQSIMSFIEKREIKGSMLYVGVMVVSLILTISLVIFQKYAIKKTNSLVVSADSLHYTGDVFMNIVFIVSLIFVSVNDSLRFLDPLMAMLVALYILKSSYKIGKKAFDNLMGKEVSKEIINQIIKIVESKKDITGYHDLKSRRMGNKCFIQIHIEIDKSISFKNAHKIAHNLEIEIRSKIANCEIIIHQDPV